VSASRPAGQPWAQAHTYAHTLAFVHRQSQRAKAIAHLSVKEGDSLVDVVHVVVTNFVCERARILGCLAQSGAATRGNCMNASAFGQSLPGRIVKRSGRPVPGLFPILSHSFASFQLAHCGSPEKCTRTDNESASTLVCYSPRVPRYLAKNCSSDGHCCVSPALVQ
jgi:hypothetical protein